jgi:cytochrome c oxidase subunit 4
MDHTPKQASKQASEQNMRGLVLTWVALLALLAASAASAWVRLGWINSAISLSIALVKALLVLVVFMRLRRAHSLVRLAAATGLCTLVLLFTLAGADYATRTEVRAPWQDPSVVPAQLGSR